MAAVEDKDMDKIIGLNTKLYGSNKFILPAEVKASEEPEQTQEFERVKLPIVSESFFEAHGSGGGGSTDIKSTAYGWLTRTSGEEEWCKATVMFNGYPYYSTGVKESEMETGGYNYYISGEFVKDDDNIDPLWDNEEYSGYVLSCISILMEAKFTAESSSYGRFESALGRLFDSLPEGTEYTYNFVL